MTLPSPGSDNCGAQGVTAPVIKSTFALSAQQIGMFFSAVTIGLVIGGRVSDRIGRKPVVLIWAATYGISCVAAALSRDFAMLFALRLIGGISLGGSLPNLIAVAAEASAPGRRHSAVTIAYAGAPAGAALVSLVAAVTGGWRLLFTLSGLASILIVPLLARLSMARPATGTEIAAGPQAASRRGLFGDAASTARTLALWAAFCCTSLMLYLLISWLPLLFVAKGLSRAEANLIQVSFTAVGVIPSLVVGRAMEAYDSRLACSAAFAVLLGAILMLAAAPPQFAVLLLEVGLLGIGINAAQAITYSIAPAIYAPQIRATGVGMAVAAARLGGIAGPLLATALVAIGWQTGGIFLAVIPIAAISCICILLLLPATRQAVKARAQA